MKLRIATASQGVQWVRDGFVAFRKQPMALTSLFFFFVLILGMVGVVPVAGFFLTFGLVPLFSLAMMIGGAMAMQGQTPSVPAVLQALRMDKERRMSFAILGVAFIAGLLLALGISALFDGGQFARLILVGGQVKQESFLEAGTQGAAFALMALYLVLTAVFWHAPGLVYWHRVPAIKALFFSVVAVMRNVGAFTIYGITWMVVNIGAILALMLVAGLVGAVAGMTGGAIIIVAGSLMLSAIYFVSVVFSFRDCFEAPAQDSTTTDL